MSEIKQYFSFCDTFEARIIEKKHNICIENSFCHENENVEIKLLLSIEIMGNPNFVIQSELNHLRVFT